MKTLCSFRSLSSRGMKICLLSALVACALSLQARTTYNFNADWRIDRQKKTVTLPHAWNEDEAFRVSTNDLSGGEVWYRKTFSLDRLNLKPGQRVFIEFEGARIAAEVTLNGQRLGLHENGVMAFGFDLTPYIKKGDNLLEVRTDSRMDYREKATNARFQWHSRAFFANYGGLSKNVWLHVTGGEVYQTLPLFSTLGTTGQYVYARDFVIDEHRATVCVESQVMNAGNAPVHRALKVTVKERDGREIARFIGKSKLIAPQSCVTLTAEQRLDGLHFWSWGYGYLYDVETSLLSPDETEEDAVVTTTGFRKTEFRNGMIYLNDRVMTVHGYAQRSTNEWPGVGSCVPAWLSDYSNGLFVRGGGNVVRWMHVTPGRQDVASCDRVGLIQALPAGDAERDAKGRQWVQRLELMRDAIVYCRNNPSVLFYECGNQRISGQHMIEMKGLRNEFDPHGGRAIGSREMLDQPEAEYGGEMLYVNKSDTKPMWQMEYCRDEALRLYWNSWSYPFHKEGDGPLYRGGDPTAWNHNNDEFVAELVRRWYDYWLERPGTGTKVNSGGVKIIFSDTQTHGRSADNYRVSGVVDPMRVEKDAYWAHRVMWDGWVDDLAPHTYIVGHWQYERGFRVPTVYVVSNADSVCLYQNGRPIEAVRHDYRFLWTFKDVPVESDRLEAKGFSGGELQSQYALETPGAPAALKLTPILNPLGWKADGADVALVQVEVTDAQGRRCPLDNRMIKWRLKGAAEWRGGVAKSRPGDAVTNHALCDTLPVECGVNRVMLRSLPGKSGKVTLTARAEGLPEASLTLETEAVETTDGLSDYRPERMLPSLLERGETPRTPSFVPRMENVYVIDVEAGSNKEQAYRAIDRYENTDWVSAADLDSAWITFTLADAAPIDVVCLKMGSFRNASYAIAIEADGREVWRGRTPKALSYVRLPLKDAPRAARYTIRLVGQSNLGDAFGMVQELDSRNDEQVSRERRTLKIIEAEFLRNIR